MVAPNLDSLFMSVMFNPQTQRRQVENLQHEHNDADEDGQHNEFIYNSGALSPGQTGWGNIGVSSRLRAQSL